MNKQIYQLLVLLHCLLLCGVAYSQAGQAYYYFGDERVYLQEDPSRIELILKGSQKTKSFGGYIAKGQVPHSELTEMHVVGKGYLAHRKGERDRWFYTRIRQDQHTAARHQDALLQTLNERADVFRASPAYISGSGDTLGLTANFYVKLKNETDVALMEAKAAEHGAAIQSQNQYMPLWYTLYVKKGTPYNALEVANQLYETGLFRAVEPEFLMNSSLSAKKKEYSHASLASQLRAIEINDPYFPQQWNLATPTLQNGFTQGIRADSAWNLSKGKNVIVAVLDTGVDPDVIDLRNKVLNGYDASTGTLGARVYAPHGTHVASIIAATQNNHHGISGVAPEVIIEPISFSPQNQTLAKLADALNYVRSIPQIRVVNMSLGISKSSTILLDAMYNLLLNNTNPPVVVVGAGNDGTDMDTKPYHLGKYFEDVLVVGSSTTTGSRAQHSNYGNLLDVVAPGERVPAMNENNQLSLPTGTSYAAPHVSGVAALIYAQNTFLSSKQIMTAIRQTATKTGGYNYAQNTSYLHGYYHPDSGPQTVPRTHYFSGWNQEMGYGLVNACAAVYWSNALYNCLFTTPNCATNTRRHKRVKISTSVKTGYVDNFFVFAEEAAHITSPSDPSLAGFHVPSGSSAKITNSNGHCEAPSKRKQQLDLSILATESPSTPIDLEEASPAIKMTLFPNPTTGMFIVTVPEELGALQRVSIYDQETRTVWEQSYEASARQSAEVNLKDLPAGVYFVDITTAFEKQLLKLRKE